MINILEGEDAPKKKRKIKMPIDFDDNLEYDGSEFEVSKPVKKVIIKKTKSVGIKKSKNSLF